MPPTSPHTTTAGAHLGRCTPALPFPGQSSRAVDAHCPPNRPVTVIPTDAGRGGLGPQWKDRERNIPTRCGVYEAQRASIIAGRAIPTRCRACADQFECAVAGRSIPTRCRACKRIAGEPDTHLGASPRVQGLPRAASRSADSAGGIPTCAGLTSWRVAERFVMRVHPHEMRGLPRCSRHEPGIYRSIPACAGLTHGPGENRNQSSVHPHVCGAYPRSTSHGAGEWGPSPRVRGLPCVDW